MKKVLVVDDEVGIVELVSGLLKRQGYEVLVAYDGGEAVRMAEIHHPDLVLLDIQMPASIGVSVLVELKTSPETAHIPVMVVSGTSSAEMRLAAKEAGARDFIPKPYSPKKLISRVGDFLKNEK